MKKCFFLAICLCRFSLGGPIQDHTLNPGALSHLARALGIPEEADLLVETQKQWLRKPNQERWEVAELSLDQKVLVLNWAKEQGFFASWKPATQNYDKVIILGATTSRMQMRLDYLCQLWNEGTRFNEIVWLTGDRPLDKRVDDLSTECTTESRAAHLLWERALLPEEIKSLPVLFVATPLKIEGDSVKRPTTEDTLITWLKINPTPCKVLFISNQPFCGYQFAVIKASLPDPFMFDLVGPGVSETSSPVAAVILDSIARWLYQE